MTVVSNLRIVAVAVAVAVMVLVRLQVLSQEKEETEELEIVLEVFKPSIESFETGFHHPHLPISRFFSEIIMEAIEPI